MLPPPLELVMEPFMVEILVRLKRSLLFQSEHPYVNMLHRQLVTCRDATSVTLRFDTECCSEEDDVFAVFQSCYYGLAREAFPKIYQYQHKYC